MKQLSTTPTGYYRHASRAAWLGLGVNLALGVVKLAGGIAAESFALISDAVNSLGDSLTSVVVLAALWYAQRPPDEEHPYGHTRAEAVAASNVALLIILTALFVGWEAVRRFSAHHEVPPAWTLWIAAANVIIKESLYRYKLQVGRRTGSSAIIANAWDHRSDALCSLAVLIGLAVVRGAGSDYAWADEAAALIDLDLPRPGADIRTGHLGPGYGVPDTRSAAAIDLLARTEAVITDPVYSGKGAAGMLALAASSDGPLLWWHTGGYHALFDPDHARMLAQARAASVAARGPQPTSHRHRR